MKDSQIKLVETEIVDLVIHLKNNEMEYFDEFYEKTKKIIFHFIYSITKDFNLSEDLLQDTYLSFLKHIKSVREKTVMSYLFKIAQNKSINELKKKKREERLDYEKADEYETEIPNNSDYNSILELMKKELNDVEFQVVVLHVIEGLTHKEISQMLKKPLGTITWTYNNAIRKVRSKING